jgi:peptidoglycan L-alanyl-D-glutamate endopeptidase CwlK
MSRDLNELTPELLALYREFNIKMGEARLIHVVTCTSRTILEQMALYTMGRLLVGDVNLFRHAAGLYPIGIEENKKVTWTLNSKHVTNMFDKDLNNDKARALDFAILNKKGQAIWDLKVSLNDNEIPDYEEAARIGESVGLVSGGRWKNPDWPHLELKEE